MRLKSAIWVKSYIRRCQANDIPAYVIQKGHESAGAIFIKLSLRDGRSVLYTPAPQIMLEEGERRWQAYKEGVPQSDIDIDKKIEREKEFDPDLWLVELETADGKHCLLDEEQLGQSSKSNTLDTDLDDLLAGFAFKNLK